MCFKEWRIACIWNLLNCSLNERHYSEIIFLGKKTPTLKSKPVCANSAGNFQPCICITNVRKFRAEIATDNKIYPAVGDFMVCRKERQTTGVIPSYHEQMIGSMSSLFPHSHFDSERDIFHDGVEVGEHYFIGVNVV